MVRGAVEKVHNIEEAEAGLRKILDVPTEKRFEFFERLRANYPVRREFQNTQIVLEPPCKSLAEKLSGIGFRETGSKR